MLYYLVVFAVINTRFYGSRMDNGILKTVDRGGVPAHYRLSMIENPTPSTIAENS
jgi:hypothetical protein